MTVKFKRALSILISAALLFAVVPLSFAADAEPDNISKLNELMEFSSALYEMTSRYSVKVTAKDCLADPYSTARLIVKSWKKLDYSGSVAYVNGHNGLHIIQYRTPDEARAAAERYEKQRNVEYVTADKIFSVCMEPGSESFLSWGFGKDYIGTYAYAEALLESVGGLENLPSITVAVVDTGVDLDHPFLKSRIVSGGWDFVNNDGVPDDDFYHGTHVAGTVVDGTLPNVKIMPIKCMDNTGDGTTANIALAMEYAYLKGCSVANVSIIGYDPSGDQLYSDVINAGSDSGCVYCAAAGNFSYDAGYFIPAKIERCCTVAAHDENKNLAAFSNYGSCVDITAPGVNIYSCWIGGGYNYEDGTSMATPHVSAACAMIRSFRPELSADETIDTIKSMAVDVGIVGGGTGILRLDPAFITGYQPPEILLGDVDMNGVVNANDALMLMRYTLGLIPESALDIMAADYDENGTVNANDALAIFRRALGLSNH